uniref:Uncharacterized protein n=1 Tax=Mycena chlorophos TaxID=658473 RepID=A0ABQ0LLR3_MYCCL|nr:predicted protein [Mycena chlorophos]
METSHSTSHAASPPNRWPAYKWWQRSTAWTPLTPQVRVDSTMTAGLERLSSRKSRITKPRINNSLHRQVVRARKTCSTRCAGGSSEAEADRGPSSSCGSGPGPRSQCTHWEAMHFELTPSSLFAIVAFLLAVSSALAAPAPLYSPRAGEVNLLSARQDNTNATDVGGSNPPGDS